MAIGVNQILNSLEFNTPSMKHDIEDLIHQQREKLSSSSDKICHLLIDVDTTLERLYGGYHADWLSGGEWSHLYSYILSLLKTCQDLSLCLIFCFDGTLYRSGQSQWYYEQIQQRKKVNQIFKHLKQNKIGLPRRNLWFSPPTFQLCFRLIVRELNSPYLLMYQTYGYGHGEHQKQMKIYAQQYASSLIGIVSSDMEFLLKKNFVGKYFSSKHFKLSLKGKITLVEVQFNQLKDKLNVNQQEFALLVTLLGNHLLSESDLIHFHNDLLHDQRSTSKTNSILSPSSTSEACSPDNNHLDTSEDHHHTSSSPNPSYSNLFHDQLITRLIEFIKKSNFDNENDLQSISNQVFKHLTDDETRKMKTQLIIDSYRYYFQAINDSSQLENSTTSFSSCQTSIKQSDDTINFENYSGINIEILRTAFNLHKQGLMMPWIFQCLYYHEIAFPVSIEPEMCTNIPNICEFYRPIRKYLYSILFESSTIIREQVYNSEHGSYLTEISSEVTSSKSTIEQLWFGTNPDQDRQKRLKTFLQSLIYCHSSIILSQSHEYLLLICLLRYIHMEFQRYSSTIFHSYELLAFLSQAVLINELQPKSLMNCQSINHFNQYEHIQIKTYETRPIQLAHLFLRGYETLIFANELCGAPIHPKYSCLTHFFHGKFFHQKYLQAQYYQQNQDLILILADGNVHCAQIISNLFDIILDRTMNNQIHHTPVQQQYQYSSILQPHEQQQRVFKSGSKQGRTQTFLANSIRPPMRNNYKQIGDNHQQTPITNFRQQLQPPPVKQPGQMRNGGNKKNNNNNNSSSSITPFNIKNQPQLKKLQTHTPTSLNIHSQQQLLPNEQWNSNHVIIPHSHLQSVPIPPHSQTLNNNYINQLDEQFLHLHLQHPPVLSTPIAYSHPSSMLTPHISMIPYNHLQPSPYTLPAYYQTSSTTTPYQPPPHPQMIPGLPPHAPIHPQRTTNYPQRLSPTSMQAQETNIQIFQQQTPISLQRQMNRLPTIDYSQFDLYHSTPNNGIPIPPMLIDHSQRLHGH